MWGTNRSLELQNSPIRYKLKKGADKPFSLDATSKKCFGTLVASSVHYTVYIYIAYWGG